MPKFSIITVVLNDCENLKLTLDSVLGQSFANTEYIVIDGGSSDGSWELIEQHKEHISYSVSERDAGLYDAMNKGLRQAKGEFVCFLNAGDCLISPHTLSELAPLADEHTDVLFGEVVFVDKNRNALGTRSQLTTQKLPANLNWQSLRYGMVVSHQGLLVRRTIAPAYIADNLCADIDWLIKVLKASRRSTRFHQSITEYLVGGMSEQRFAHSMWDRFHILGQHFGYLRTTIDHFAIIARALLFRRTAKAEIYRAAVKNNP